VNDAFFGLVSGINSGKIPTIVVPSRAGEVMMVEEPVIVTYENPRERVLFAPGRDANPFFHLFESLWMLAGRRDVAPLAYYNSKIADIASDDGETFNGAYGYRWRKRNLTKDWEFPDEPIDQLETIIDHLKNKPESRRTVLQMWNVEDDLLKIDSSKDVCCNTHAYFSVETGDCPDCETGWEALKPDGGRVPCSTCDGQSHDVPRYLNMTVCNRSNDLLWGMLGANVVHFSILQEYLATRIGLEVGRYHQITNNLHVYTKRWKPEELLEGCSEIDYYNWVGKLQPIVEDWKQFDLECSKFVDDVDQEWEEPFLNQTAKPMMSAFKHHKNKKYDLAFEAVSTVKADDWRIVGRQWLLERETRYATRKNQT